LARAQKIEALCSDHAVPLRAAALQFPMAHAAIDIILLGARHADEWTDGLAMMRHPCPPDFWQALRQAALVPETAPLPGDNA
jgi:D-threo-aldose 1-dehydrogenase